MNETITVFIHDGDELPRAITVRVSDSIRIIDEEVQVKGQRVFYWNGSIILPAFSFNYFGIKDMDHIFVIRVKEHKDVHNMMISNLQISSKKALPMKEKMKRMMLFKENHHKQYSFQPDAYLLHEASRIADLTYIQNEKRLILKNCFPSEPEETIPHTKTLDIKQQTLVSTSTLPSSEALPQAWRSF